MTSWKVISVSAELHERLSKAKGKQSFNDYINANTVFVEAKPEGDPAPATPVMSDGTGL